MIRGDYIVNLFEDVRIIPKVDKVQIRNYGIIKKADITFSSGLNLIVGRNASGKTTVLSYLAREVNNKLIAMAKGNKHIMEIDIITSEQCWLIDNMLYVLDDKKLNEALLKFQNSKIQIIATIGIERLIYIDKNIKANIIYTKDFQLRTYSREYDAKIGKVIDALELLQDRLGILIQIPELKNLLKNKIKPIEVDKCLDILEKDGVIIQIKKGFVKFI